jgi:hypothetical protein
MRKLTYAFASIVAAFLVACSTGGGREIEVVATDQGCTPTTISAAPKEKLTFKFVNNANGDREIEGIEGTKLEEVLIPKGRTRSINYTTPSEAGTVKLKCYIPGGPTTIIEVNVAANAG